MALATYSCLELVYQSLELKGLCYGSTHFFSCSGTFHVAFLDKNIAHGESSGAIHKCREAWILQLTLSVLVPKSGIHPLWEPSPGSWLRHCSLAVPETWILQGPKLPVIIEGLSQHGDVAEAVMVLWELLSQASNKTGARGREQEGKSLLLSSRARSAKQRRFPKDQEMVADDGTSHLTPN